MLTNDPRPYFDPQTGEQITAEQFVERYTVNAFVFVERTPEAYAKPGTASLPGLKTFGGKCRYCGLGLAEGQTVCDTCAEKHNVNRAPSTSWAIGANAPQDRSA